MAELTGERRKNLPTSEFAMPDERKYPIDTRGRAANAKARAEQQFKRGNLSESEKARIDEKANRLLYGSSKAPSDGAKKVASAMVGKR